MRGGSLKAGGLLSDGGGLPSEGGGLHLAMVGQTPLHTWDTTRHGQQKGGTHPTGMHIYLQCYHEARHVLPNSPIPYTDR